MTIFNETGLRDLQGDIFGGVAAAVIVLSMALAFGVASVTGVETDLITRPAV